MNLTEVSIKLADPAERNTRIRAYCSVVLCNAFVIRDIKIVATASGRLLVVMPTRELRTKCRCGGKNSLRVRYCGWCGVELDPDRTWTNKDGLTAQYADVCHPVSAEARATFEAIILDAYAAVHDGDYEDTTDYRLTAS